jgi:hypothetical protein
MTQMERAKVIYSIVSHQKKKTDLTIQGREATKADKDKAKCFLCDHAGHKTKKYWYYDATKNCQKKKRK